MGLFDRVDMDFLRKRAALKWGRWEDDVISLSVADIDFPAPDFIKESVARTLEEDRTPYGQFAGDLDVLETVCDKLNRDNKIPATPEDVHMIPGTMFSIFMICHYALSPGDEAVICPGPMYPPFMSNVKNAKATPVFNPVVFNPEGCRLDLDNLRKQITSKTRLLMVCNPHNPCGLVMTRRELEGIADIAREYDLPVFCDELYEDMMMDGEHISLASIAPDMFERTVSVFGFSKAFGMPGFRIAYIVNRGRHMENLRGLMHDIIVHTDTMAQAAAKGALLAGSEWLTALRDHLREMRDFGLMRLNKMPGVTCHRPQATPFLFPDFSAFGLTSDKMTEYLREEARVILNSGSGFGLPGEGYARINTATSKDVLAEAFDRIEAALAKLGA